MGYSISLQLIRGRLRLTTSIPMNRRNSVRIRMLAFMVGVFLLGACSGTSSPVKQFTKGAELVFYDFTTPATFEEGLYGNGNARLQIANGVYNISVTAGDNTLYYGQWGSALADVVVDVEARQTSEDVNTTYGVICRARGTVGQTIEAVAEATESAGSDTIMASADSEGTSEATLESTAEVTAEATIEAAAEGGTSNALRDNTSNNGDGYLFMIQGSGRYAILRSQGRKITPLVNWASSSAINTSAAQNRIRAVCMGSYLALYVNGQFIADATDDLYTQGQIGLVGASAGRTGMAVTFDNLSISAVSEAKTG